ncbi:hypothetical protein SAMN05216275_10526 [Streptosporangium canum]|uniref:Uncharacterized protein n=1 Tax=Streptosporangium canum TaxID=324952 RepID=A0A1I3L688_9ACTN|nr:hypothetical protein SAMN05216275_10526 [Streptosporangium canum]
MRQINDIVGLVYCMVILGAIWTIAKALGLA